MPAPSSARYPFFHCACSLVIALAGTAMSQAQPAAQATLSAMIDAAVTDWPQGAGTVERTVVPGSELPMLVLRGPGSEPGARPVVLIVAGMDGRHTIGQEVAVNVGRALASRHAQTLAVADVIIVPCADAAVSSLAQGGAIGPSQLWTARRGPGDDADGDGRVDEDGPEDIDGDGVVSWMRVAHPRPGLGADVVAEWVIDEKDSRVMRRAERDKGQRATHALLVESRDSDGDGRYAEDPPGSVVMNRHFPHQWPEHDSAGGRFPLDDADTRALAELVLRTPTLAAVFVYGPNDTLTKVPAAGQFDASGQVPTGIERGDEAMHKRWSEAFASTTRIESVPAWVTGGFGNGSFAGWAYAHAGVPVLATPVWVRPDMLKKQADAGPPADKKDEPAPDVAAEAGGEREPVVRTLRLAGVEVELTAAGVSSALDAVAKLGADRQRAFFHAIVHLDPADRAALLASSPARVSQRAEAASGEPVEAEEAGEGGSEARRGAGEEGAQPARRRGVIGVDPEQLRASEAQSQPEAAANEPARARGGRAGAGGQPRGAATAGRTDRAAGSDASDDAAWLAYLDGLAREGEPKSTSGFVAWKRFEHPQLGEVEIGGFSADAKLNPPAMDSLERAELLGRLVDEQARFVASVVGELPRVRVEEPTAQATDDGGAGGGWTVVRVGIRLINEGVMPTRSAIGVKVRRHARTTVRIDLPRERLISGQPVVGVDRIDGGGEWASEWLVLARTGDVIELVVSDPTLGDRRVGAEVRAGGAGLDGGGNGAQGDVSEEARP